MSFASSEGILSGLQPPPSKFRSIATIEEAHRWATEQPPDAPSPTDWTGLREQQAAKFARFKPGLSGTDLEKFEADYRSTVGVLSNAVGRIMKLRGFELAENEVVSDLVLIATSRLLQGTGGDFWEALLTIYKLGLWPCGWDGAEYPSGRFAVFRPEERK